MKPEERTSRRNIYRKKECQESISARNTKREARCGQRNGKKTDRESRPQGTDFSRKTSAATRSAGRISTEATDNRSTTGTLQTESLQRRQRQEDKEEQPENPTLRATKQDRSMTGVMNGKNWISPGNELVFGLALWTRNKEQTVSGPAIRLNRALPWAMPLL